MDTTPLFYDYIVVGCGVIGSATLYQLSKNTKYSVLGLEQFELGHDHGSSQDHSRIIRHTYHDEIYTRLTRHAYDAWAEVEKESGLQLVYKCGNLAMARRGSPAIEIINKFALALDKQNIPYERLSASQLMMRYPQWRVDDNTEALYQAEGGIIDASLSNSVLIQRFPVFSFYTPDGFYVYGVPLHGNSYLKVGVDGCGNTVLPTTRTYVPDVVREQYCKEWSQKHLPKSEGPVKYTKTCLYTMSLDRHFIVDTLASKCFPQIVVFCCGSGHAYKFATLLGKILAELATNGSTQYDISAFSMAREAVQNEHFKPSFTRGDMNAAKL